MIGLNEPNEYAAETPFTLPTIGDPLLGLLGHSFTLGQVKYKIGVGGSFNNASLSKIFEKGYGRYVLRHPASELTTALPIFIDVDVPGLAQPYRGIELIGNLGGDIAQGGSGYMVAYLPDAIDPVYGAPASGAFASLPGALFRVCYPDDVYADVDPDDVINIGGGFYAFPPAITTKRGKAFFYAEATGFQRFESYITILTGELQAPIVPPGPDPLPTPIPASSPLFINHYLNAIERLPEQFRRRHVG